MEAGLRDLAQYARNRTATTKATTDIMPKRSGMLSSTSASRGTLSREMENCPKLRNVE